MKFLAPEALCAAIIGKAGSVVKDLRSKYSAKISLTDAGDFYPRTDCRVLMISAASQETVDGLIKELVAKVVEADKAMDDGELTLKALVPHAAAGGVIGKSGGNIKQLRESSGAMLKLENPWGKGPSADQVMTTTGSAEALEQVYSEVNKQIQLVNTESWFPTWASSSGTGRGDSESWSDSYQGSSGRGWGNDYYDQHGLNMLWDTANALPPYVLEDERGFQITCKIPNNICGGLIGVAGSHTKQVSQWTGATISFRDIPGDDENRSLQISGQVMHVTSAYMMMMHRYLDVEAGTK